MKLVGAYILSLCILLPLAEALDTKIPSFRSLQESECGEVLATWTSDEVGSIVEAGIDRGLGPMGADLKSLALPKIRFGVQVRKLCAVCTDHLSEEDCGYGGSVAHSGLLMIPLEDDNSSAIAGGTHKAVIYNHGTRAVAQPSSDWAGEESDVEITLNALYTSTARTVTIMSDYMSQGESFGKVYRGYIVRKSYETSVVPLLLEATKIVEDETDCSAVADSVFIMGYSEGGYSSVTVAEKLHSMGFDIIRVDAGGAPFWVSSGTFVDIVHFVNNQTFPPSVRFYLQYLGFGFSSSRDDMPNFEQGQDMLSSEARQNMIDFLESGVSPLDEQAGIDAANSLVPEEDMLSIYNPEFIEFIQTAIQENDLDPCTNRPTAGTNDLLCQALQAQDIHVVLQNAAYPVLVCFSPDDEIVSIRNVPDLSGNPNLSFLQAAGTHSQAGNMCFVSSTSFVLSEEFDSYEVADKTSESCGLKEIDEPESSADTNAGTGEEPSGDDESSAVNSGILSFLVTTAFAFSIVAL